MTFTTDQQSHRGGRRINEDAAGYRSVRSGLHCWVLADGLGGHGGGEVASQLAVERVLAAFERGPALAPAALEGYVEAAQQALLARQRTDDALAAMRTTVVILLADAHAALWGYVGDSRLYHLRQGRIVHQTRDHSVPQAMVAAGDLQPEDVRRHEDRSRLLRALGQGDEVRPTVEPPCPLQPGDAFLLCSDGFWEYVYETEMEVDFAKAEGPPAWLQAMQERLYRRAGPENDNYSAVGVFVLP